MGSSNYTLTFNNSTFNLGVNLTKDSISLTNRAVFNIRDGAIYTGGISNTDATINVTGSSQFIADRTISLQNSTLELRDDAVFRNNSHTVDTHLDTKINVLGNSTFFANSLIYSWGIKSKF